MANMKRPARKAGGRPLPGVGFPDLRGTLWRLLLLCLVTQPLHAFLPPKLPPELDAKLKALPRISPPQPVVRGNRTYHGDRGTLRSWRPGNVWVPAGDPRTMAETFLRRYARDLSLKPDLSDLTLVSVRQMDSAARVTFQQVYQGVPLDGVQVVVVVRLDGRILHVMSDYVPHLNVDLQGSPIGCDRAIQAVKDFWGLPVRIRSSYACSFQILVHPRPRPVYAVRFSPKGIGGRWLGMVDAYTGEILSVYQYSIPFQDATARSGTTSAAWFRAARETRPTGAIISMSSRVLHPLPASEDRTTSCKKGTIQPLLSIIKQKLSATVYPLPPIQIRQNPSETGAWIYSDTVQGHPVYILAIGGRGFCPERDPGILAHEGFHTLEMDMLSEGFCRGPGCSVESAAIGEALADVWGGMYAVQAQPGYGNTLGKWGLLPRGRGRALATLKRYPEDLTPDPHTTGQILSGALWATFRSPDASLPAEVLQRWMVTALFRYLWRNATLRDAARALLYTLAEDPALCAASPRGCVHLVHALHRRNLLPSPPPLPLAWTRGPAEGSLPPLGRDFASRGTTAGFPPNRR